MNTFNTDTILATIKQLIEILERNHIEYRFLGSVLAAAVNGKLHRNLGDIDLIIDAKKKDLLYSELQKRGYFPIGGMYEFARKYMALETLRHEKLAEIGYFYGEWQKDGSIVMGNGAVRASIDPVALKPTTYALEGVKFTGVNPRAAATRILASQGNPKRRKELVFFKDHSYNPLPNNFIHLTVFGYKCDWIYHAFSAFQNSIGVIRISLGLPFDPWR